MTLSDKERELVEKLRGVPQSYQDNFVLVHFSPVNDTHIMRVLEGRPATLGVVTKAFYRAFMELKTWLGLSQATFLLDLSDGDICRVFTFVGGDAGRYRGSGNAVPEGRDQP